MARRGQLAELDLPDGRAASRARQPPRLTRRASPPRLALRSAQWAVDAGGGGEDEPLTEDEALARQLQADEAADWRARMLALAGLQPGGDAGEGAYDDEAEAEADEVDVDAMRRVFVASLPRSARSPHAPQTLTPHRRPSYEQLLDLGAAAGAVSRGVADGFVLRLPRRRVTTEELSANDLCAVCRQEYVAEEELSELRCGHAFHGACLAPWLRAEKHCPSCRHDVVSPALAAKPAPNS